MTNPLSFLGLVHLSLLAFSSLLAFLSQLEGERMGRRLEETEKACLEAARLAEKEVRKALFTYGMLNIRVGCC